MDEDKRIILNKIKCLHCGDIIVSVYTHDYKNCSCGKISVDGGKSYLKRGFDEPTDYEEMSLYDDAPFEEIRKNLRWGTFGRNGDQPLKYIAIDKMTNEHIMNILRLDKPGLTWIQGHLANEWEYRKENKILIVD